MQSRVATVLPNGRIDRTRTLVSKALVTRGGHVGNLADAQLTAAHVGRDARHGRAHAVRVGRSGVAAARVPVLVGLVDVPHAVDELLVVVAVDGRRVGSLGRRSVAVGVHSGAETRVDGGVVGRG